jgi:hypothetical protein
MNLQYDTLRSYKRFRLRSVCHPEALLPVATVLLVTLQWGGLLEVAVANELEDCATRELRCEILCHLVELELQCEKCRSRAPVRFGKRVGEKFRLPQSNRQQQALQRADGLVRDNLCCGQFLSLLLHNAKKSPRQHRK